MTTERLTDEALADEGLAAFAAYFRKNYPGPDTIISNPDWHAPRLYRAALDAHRRAQSARLDAELERALEPLQALKAAAKEAGLQERLDGIRDAEDAIRALRRRPA